MNTREKIEELQSSVNVFRDRLSRYLERINQLECGAGCGHNLKYEGLKTVWCDTLLTPSLIEVFMFKCRYCEGVVNYKTYKNMPAELQRQVEALDPHLVPKPDSDILKKEGKE